MSRPLITSISAFLYTVAILCPESSQAAPARGPVVRAVATDDSRTPSFSVASIRLNTKSDGTWGLFFTADGFSARGVTLRQLIEEAYGIYDDDRILGDSLSLDRDRYDIQAKVDDSDEARYLDMERDQREILLRKLLVERFSMRAHLEDQVKSIYKLVVVKGGPRFDHTGGVQAPEKGIDPPAHVKRIGRGHLELEQFSMADLARKLTHFLDRQVVDGTGLSGRYDLTLDWNPGTARPGANGTAQSQEFDDDPRPGLFTAVKEQLGLQLLPDKGPITVVVVDDLHHPTGN